MEALENSPSRRGPSGALPRGGRGVAILALSLLAAACSGDGTSPDETMVVLPDSVALDVGGSAQFSARNASEAVTWESSDPGVADVVAQTGFVSAAGPGVATVTARSGAETATARVRVRQPASITLSDAALTFAAIEGEGDVEPREVQIENGGETALTGLGAAVVYTAGPSNQWLSAVLSGTAAPATLTLQPQTGGLAPGSYAATVTVSSSVTGVTPRTITVEVTVEAAPVIALSAESATFAATAGESDPAAREITITNDGGGTLDGLTVSTPPAWLEATLSATTAPATLTIQPRIAGLNPGTHEATLTLASSVPGVAPREVEVAFTVTAAPLIGLSATTLDFTAMVGGADPAAREVDVTNTGGGVLSGLTVTGQPAWLSVTLGGATAPTTLTVQPTIGSLGDGVHTAELTIESSVSGVAPRTLDVTFTVAPGPSIGLSATALDFSANAGGADPAAQQVDVTNAGGGVLSGLSVSGHPEWLSVSLSGTTAPATLTVRPAIAGLPEGDYTAQLTIASSIPGVAPREIDVTLTVGPVVLTPLIGLSVTTLDFTATAGGSDPAAQEVDVANAGGGVLSGLSVSGQPGWLSVSLSGAMAPTTLTVQPTTAGLTEGPHTAVLTVSSSIPDVPSVTLDVTFTVGPAPSIDLSATTVVFTATAGSGDPPAQEVDVTNAGGGTLDGLTVSAPPAWLEATLSSTAAPATLTIQPRIAGQNPGTYTTTLTVASSVPGVTAREIDIELTVDAAPVIVLSRTSLSFTATIGDVDPPAVPVAVINGGGGTLSGLSVSGQTAWLSASLSGETALATLTVQPAIAGLAEGVHTAQLTVASSLPGVAPQTLDVRFAVEPEPAELALSASTAAFPTGIGVGNIASVEVTSTGEAIGSLSTSVSGGPWLAVSLNAAITPARLTLRVTTPGSLGVGTHEAVVTVSSAEPGVASRTVAVAYTITQSFSADVAPLLASSTCSGCHSNVVAGAGLNLDAAVSYGQLVEVPAVRGSGEHRVDPWEPSESFLVCVLRAACGTSRIMPPGVAIKFSESQIQTIEAWVREGAPNN